MLLALLLAQAVLPGVTPDPRPRGAPPITPSRAAECGSLQEGMGASDWTQVLKGPPDEQRLAVRRVVCQNAAGLLDVLAEQPADVLCKLPWHAATEGWDTAWSERCPRHEGACRWATPGAADEPCLTQSRAADAALRDEQRPVERKRLESLVRRTLTKMEPTDEQLDALVDAQVRLHYTRDVLGPGSPLARGKGAPPSLVTSRNDDALRTRHGRLERHCESGRASVTWVQRKSRVVVLADAQYPACPQLVDVVDLDDDGFPEVLLQVGDDALVYSVSSAPAKLRYRATSRDDQ